MTTVGETSAPASGRPASEFGELVERIRAGSRAAELEMVERFGDHIRRVVRRRLDERLRRQFDSLDFVQDVWLSFFAIVKRDDAIQAPEHLPKFLAAIATHKVLDQLKRPAGLNRGERERAAYLPGRQGQQLGPTQVPGKGPTASNVAIAAETWAQLVARLPERHRRMLELKQAGCGLDEIAAAVGMNEKTVRRLLEKLDPYERGIRF